MKVNCIFLLIVFFLFFSCRVGHDIVPNYKRISEYKKDLEYLSGKHQMFRDSIRVNRNKKDKSRLEMFRDSAKVTKSKANYRAKLNDFDLWNDFQYRYFINRKK